MANNKTVSITWWSSKLVIDLNSDNRDYFRDYDDATEILHTILFLIINILSN